ncbi:hypothetical protein K523DRAFT_48838 [Schizophyllum commune Tattone D]|nr:hypothetical protein K523DRAFT_48838 [Schizophyllum commune Tattone D]
MCTKELLRVPSLRQGMSSDAPSLRPLHLATRLPAQRPRLTRGDRKLPWRLRLLPLLAPLLQPRPLGEALLEAVRARLLDVVLAQGDGVRAHGGGSEGARRVALADDEAAAHEAAGVRGGDGDGERGGEERKESGEEGEEREAHCGLVGWFKWRI